MFRCLRIFQGGILSTGPHPPSPTARAGGRNGVRVASRESPIRLRCAPHSHPARVGRGDPSSGQAKSRSRYVRWLRSVGMTIFCAEGSETRSHFRCSFQPANGFAVPQLGPPSLPVPRTRASRTAWELIISHVIPPSGIFRRRLQAVSAWPA